MYIINMNGNFFVKICIQLQVCVGVEHNKKVCVYTT